MDFMERLTDKVNAIDALPEPLKMGYLDVGESFVIYPIPGSRVTREFYDGEKDVSLNFEIAMKSQSSKKIHDTLWIVQNELERIENVDSSNGSFVFRNMGITNKPYINQIDDKGWQVFLLNFTAFITTVK